MYIKMYVTAEEKKQLEQIAQRRKIPLSKLCYEQVIPLLHNPIKDSTVYLPNQTAWEKCTHSVTLHLSDSEYDTLMKRANGSPLSRYIRSVLLYHSEPIRIEVYTEDISILTMQVSGYIQKLYNFIAALTHEAFSFPKASMTEKRGQLYHTL